MSETEHLQQLRDWASRHRRGLTRAAVTIGTVSLVMGVLALSWLLAGPISTIAYSVLFVLGLTLVPVSILLFSSILPNGLGRGMFILGQLAFDEGWLVQHQSEWRMHPGRTRRGQSEVFLGGEWRVINDDSKKTIFGWAPFGLLLDKHHDTLAAVRVDADQQDPLERLSPSQRNVLEMTASDMGVDIGEVSVEPATRSDGGSGESALTRGGVKWAADPERRFDSDWELDLTRWWSDSLSRMGDIDVVEKIEEVTMRNEAMGDQNRRRNTWIGVAIGLFLGAMTGLVSMGVF